MIVAQKWERDASTVNPLVLGHQHLVAHCKFNTAEDPGLIGRGATVNPAMETFIPSYQNSPTLVVNPTAKITSMIQCSPTSNKHIIFHTVQRADGLALPEGSIVIPFRASAKNATDNYLFTNGLDRDSVVGSVSLIQESATGDMVARLRDASGANDVRIPAANITWTDEYPVTLSWGPRDGFRVLFNGTWYGDGSCKSGWTAPQGSVFRLGADHTGAVTWSFLGFKPGSISLFDHQPWPHWSEWYETDPFQPATALLAYTEMTAQPWTHGAYDTGFKVSVNTGIGTGGQLAEMIEYGTGETIRAYRLRFRYAKTIVEMASAECEAAAEHITLDAPCRQALWTVDNLDSQTTYYGFVEMFIGYDVTSEPRWIPLPQGLCRAFTGIYKRADHSDEHAGGLSTPLGFAERGVLTGNDSMRRLGDAVDVLLAMDPPPSHFWGHGDWTMDTGAAEETTADWSANVIKRVEFCKFMFGPACSLMSNAIMDGNWESKGRKYQHWEGKVIQKQSVLASLLCVPLGYYDGGESIVAPPDLIASVDWIPERTETDNEGVPYGSDYRSKYCVPGRLGGTVDRLQIAFNELDLVEMEDAYDFEEGDLVDAVLVHDSGSLARVGMNVLVVGSSSISLQGGAGDRFDEFTGDGPFVVYVHPVTHPNRLLIANGLQTTGSVELTDSGGRKRCFVLTNREVHWQVSVDHIGFGAEYDGSLAINQKWGALGEWIRNTFDASDAVSKELHLHRDLAIDDTTYRDSGINWMTIQTEDGLAFSLSMLARNVKIVRGHEHNYAISCVGGLWMILIPQILGSLHLLADTLGTASLFGADKADDGLILRAAAAGVLLFDYGTAIESVTMLMTSIACTDTVVDLTVEPCAFGPEALPANPTANTVTVPYIPVRTPLAITDAAFQAQGGLAGWFPDNIAALLAANVSLDSGDNLYPTSVDGVAVVVDDIDVTELWTVTVPNIIHTIELAQAGTAGENAMGSERGLNDIHLELRF